MMIALYVTAAVIVLLVVPAYLAGRVARRKARPFGVYFVAGLLLGPIVLGAALLLPNRRRLV
jgi:hypothetical protein